MNTTDKIIVKVQIPLFSSDGTKEVLIYDEMRKIEVMQSFPPAALKELEARMKGEPKAFFYAQVINGVLALGDIAPWQGW